MQGRLKILRYFIIGGIFLTPFIPLFVLGAFFFPYITGKNFVFRIIVEILFGLWLCLAIFDKNYRPKKSFILTTAMAFMGILVISTFLGKNPYRSFWSNFERMEGLVGYLHLFAYFIVLASIMKGQRVWDWFFHILLFVSVIISFYGFSQLHCQKIYEANEKFSGTVVELQKTSPFCYSDKGAKNYEVSQGGVRLDAKFGNASYLAIYMVFNIFLAAF